MNDVHSFILGMLMAGYLVIGLIFGRSWRRTGDRFFLWFSLAFLLMGLNQIAFLVLGEENESRAALYLVRLASFGLIFGAIVDKNRR